MAVQIPSGYVELKKGDTIAKDDLFFPKGGGEGFKQFKPKSKAIGKPYKDVATPLYQETVVIRQFIKTLFNLRCVANQSQKKEIMSLIKTNRNFDSFNSQEARQVYLDNSSYNYFYLIIESSGRNYFGFTRKDGCTSCKGVEYKELLKLLDNRDLNAPEFTRKLVYGFDLEIKEKT